MNLQRRLRDYGLTAVISGAGLLAFWLLGDLLAPPTGGPAVRTVLLVLIAAAIGLAAGAAQRWLREGDGYVTPAEAMPGLAWSADAEGLPTGMSEDLHAFCEAASITEFSLAGPATHPDDLDAIASAWQRCQETGEDFHATLRIQGGDGRYRWFEALARPLHQGEPDEDGNAAVAGWNGLLIDIDDHKVLEESLRARDKDLRAIIDNTPGLIATADAAGELNFANRRHRDYYRTDGVDLAGLGWLTQVHPDERDAIAAAWQQSVAKARPFDAVFRLRRHDGVYRRFHARFDPVFDANDDMERWYGLIIDVEDEKRTAEALAAEQTLLRQLTDAGPGLIWSTDPAGNAQHLNRQWLDYSGQALPEAIGSGWLAALHADDRDAFVETWRAHLASATSGETEARLRRHDGEYRWFLFRMAPALDEAGKVVRWIGAAADIDGLKRAGEAAHSAQASLQAMLDDSKRAEAALAAKGEQLEAVAGTLFASVWSVNDTGEPAFVRPPSSAGAAQDPAAAETFDGLMHPDDRSDFRQRLDEARRTGEPFALRYRSRQADGTYRWLEARAAPGRDADGRVVSWYGISVTAGEAGAEHETGGTAEAAKPAVAQGSGLSQISEAIVEQVGEMFAGMVANAHACQSELESDPMDFERVRALAGQLAHDAAGAPEAVAEIIGRLGAAPEEAAETGEEAHAAAEIEETQPAEETQATAEAEETEAVAEAQPTDAAAETEATEPAPETRLPADLNAMIGTASRLAADDMAASQVSIVTDLDSALPPVLAHRQEIEQLLATLMRSAAASTAADDGDARTLLVRSGREDDGGARVDMVDGDIALADEGFDSPDDDDFADDDPALAICRTVVAAHGGTLAARRTSRGASFSFTLPLAPRNEG